LSNAQTWIAKTFGDYKAVLQFEDAENGKINIKGESDIPAYPLSRVNQSGSIDYMLTIECKDSKYRYTLNILRLSFSFSFMGSTFNTTKTSPQVHIVDINEASEELAIKQDSFNQLSNVDLTPLKKKEAKDITAKKAKLTNEIKATTKRIKEAEYFYNQEYIITTSLITSLKNGMAVNDEF